MAGTNNKQEKYILNKSKAHNRGGVAKCLEVVQTT